MTLGPSGSGAIIRVVDESTIERVAEMRTRTVTVKVKGRSCTASIDHRLKPGHTECEAYSTHGILAKYRTLAVEKVKCSIK